MIYIIRNDVGFFRDAFNNYNRTKKTSLEYKVTMQKGIHNLNKNKTYA